MIVRIPCSNPNCNHLILPETAAATGGQCRPCVNAEQRKAYLAEIERNRKEVNLYDPHDSALNWLKLSLTPRKHDPLISYTACPKTRQQLLARLNPNELDELRDTAIANLIENPHFAENILRYLSSFTQLNLLPVLPYLLNNHDYSFEQLFRYADNAITEKLIERVEQADEYQNLCLIALAWVNTPQAHQAFLKWQTQPPAWLKQPSLPLNQYTAYAHWQLDTLGNYQPLTFEPCYAIRVRSTVEQTAIGYLDKTLEACPCCTMPLETLARINPSQLGWVTAAQWEFLVCQYCTPFQEVTFFELDAQGCGHWSSYNATTHHSNTADPESAWEAFDLVIAEQRPAIERSDQFLPEDYSQVGGFPHWVQDCYYPNCPQCTQTMQFTAQLATDEFSSGVEGTFYTYICVNCSITASHYQQT